MMSGSDADAERIEVELASTLERIGFVPCASVFEEERSDAAWTFARNGSHFLTEIISCLARFQPTELFVNYIASDKNVDALRSLGVIGNGLVVNLFDFQFFTLKRDPAAILPKIIELDEANERETLARLTNELRDVDQYVWAELLKRSQATPQ